MYHISESPAETSNLHLDQKILQKGPDARITLHFIQR